MFNAFNITVNEEIMNKLAKNLIKIDYFDKSPANYKDLILMHTGYFSAKPEFIEGDLSVNVEFTTLEVNQLSMGYEEDTTERLWISSDDSFYEIYGHDKPKLIKDKPVHFFHFRHIVAMQFIPRFEETKFIIDLEFTSLEVEELEPKIINDNLYWVAIKQQPDINVTKKQARPRGRKPKV